MSASVIDLLRPRMLGLGNRWRRASRGERWTVAAFGVAGLLFWVGVWALMHFLVDGFYSVEVFGPILARKLLELLLLGLFGMLCFSNVVTALSAFYLSDDLELLLSLPVKRSTFHITRVIETLAQSSWMVLVFAVPVFAAYGNAHDAGLAYYGLLCVVLPAYVLVPAAVGVGVASVLVNVFPARRIREALVFVGVLTLAFALLFLRLLRPEQLVRADSFDSLAAYVAELQAPVPLLTPPRWASDVILASLRGTPFPWLELGLLLTGAVATFGLSRWLTDRVYDSGRARAQEARQARLAEAGWLDALLAVLTRPLSPLGREIVIKDVKSFFRDAAQWSQLFLVGSIVVIALACVWAMPLDQLPKRWLGGFRNVLAFMALGLVGFVMAAIATRFQFTAVSAEGRAFWVVRVSPIEPESLLWAKVWPTLPLMVVVGQLLAVASALLLGAGPFIIGVASGTALGLAFAISGVAVGMGALYPDFKADNVARVAASPAAMLYMVVALSLVFVVVSLEVVPVWLVLSSELGDVPLTGWRKAGVVAPLVVAAAICVAATFLPIRYGARKLWARELPNG